MGAVTMGGKEEEEGFEGDDWGGSVEGAMSSILKLLQLVVI